MVLVVLVRLLRILPAKTRGECGGAVGGGEEERVAAKHLSRKPTRDGKSEK